MIALPALQEGMERVRSFGEALSNSPRWSGYCEGLSGWSRITTAWALEQQYRFFKSMNETTRILQIGSFEKYAFPIVRAVMPNLAANDVVSVQPMAGPTSLVFYLDFLYGTTKGAITTGTSAFDSRTGPTGNETYTSDTVSGETVATGDGSTKQLALSTLTFFPVRPGTLSITATVGGAAVTIKDNGDGTIVVAGGTNGVINYANGDFTTDPIFATAPDNLTAVKCTYSYDTEAHANVPELDLSLTSASVTAEVRKIRVRHSLEAAQNFQALHGLDADVEVTNAASELIKHEIDRQIIMDLRAFAGAGTVTWDRTLPPGVSYTEHKLSLVDAFVKANNKVFSSTKRVETNWIWAGVDVCNVVETLPGFEGLPGARMPNGSGIRKIGVLNGRWTIIKDPFMTSNEWVQGWKGDGILQAGYIYAPYVPLYLTPGIILDDFIHRRGIGTQYGRKPINSLFYVKGTILNA